MALAKFGRIGVLMGGPSREREVSLRSGAAVLQALTAIGLDAVSIDVTCDDPRKNSVLFKKNRIDCAFLALHGRFGEDGTVQEILESAGIAYTGSGVDASRLAMDKSLSLDLFVKQGLVVPEYITIKRGDKFDRVALVKKFGTPIVVKPSNEGSSIGLSMVFDPATLEQALDSAFKFSDKVIVGKFIGGRELTVGILDESALPVVEIIPKKGCFDYEAKYSSGMTDYKVPAEVDDSTARELKAAALGAHKALGCRGYSRVDAILGGDGRCYILEVNTIPGMTATSLLPKAAQAAGIDFPGLCLKLIDLAHEKK